MNMNNIQALMTLKDVISYKDNSGNQLHDFAAVIEYSYKGKTVREQHDCEVINIVGYSDIGLRILTQSNEINSQTVHTEFSSAFGSFHFNENDRILIIQQGNSPKIGPYIVKIFLM